MKKTGYIFFLVFNFTVCCYSQKTIYTLKNQPQLYTYKADTSKIELDSLVEFKFFENGFNKNWDIYFSNDKKQSAYTCRLKNDSAIEKHFWRNGKLKQMSIRKKDQDGFYSVYNLEMYCSNGQLLEKYDTETACSLVFTKYHCNGQKKYEMLKDNTCNTTHETEWYTNGQKKNEIPYKNGLRDGTAYSWDQQGKVIRKVTWSSGNQ